MTPANDRQPENTTIKVELGIAGRKVRLSIPVPSGPTSPYEMLPIFRSLAESFINQAVKDAESRGKRISCTKGCGACCRQLVPISKVEAHRLNDLVKAMPEERRADVMARFAEARRSLEQSGLLERLQHSEEMGRAERIELGIDYFNQRIACPFLEDESCSIHPERPIACREYLVTTPAINCSNPTPETVECIEVVAKVSNAVAALDSGSATDPDGWIPLVLALDWAAENPDIALPEPGPDILKKMFENLAG
jgi:Fe-S-cluster containining protein